MAVEMARLARSPRQHMLDLIADLLVMRKPQSRAPLSPLLLHFLRTSLFLRLTWRVRLPIVLFAYCCLSFWRRAQHRLRQCERGAKCRW